MIAITRLDVLRVVLAFVFVYTLIGGLASRWIDSRIYWGHEHQKFMFWMSTCFLWPILLLGLLAVDFLKAVFKTLDKILTKCIDER